MLMVQLAECREKSSVTLAEKLMMSPFFGAERLKEELAIGLVESATKMIVEFCCTLLEVSVASPVKFRTQGAQLTEGVLLMVADVPEREEMMNTFPVERFPVS